MGMFIIEKNVPLPSARLRNPRHKWPWRNMEVGDSVTIPAELSAAAKNSCNAYSYRGRCRFARRRQPNGDYRFWRLE
jgi:hypothetical protein